jgi:hypothetical protein
VTITGDFETHLTIAFLEAVAAGSLQIFAAESGMKITHILLDHGREPSQLMLTRHSGGTLREALTEADGLTAQLAARGLKVRRIKIEIEATNPAAPANEREAKANPAEWYFEYHVKVLLLSLSDLEHLSEVARRSAAQLSRNAFLLRSDAREERFLTQRFYRVGRDTASEAFAALMVNLQQNRFVILDCEAEYVVFDSNVAMDAGWLDAS